VSERPADTLSGTRTNGNITARIRGRGALARGLEERCGMPKQRPAHPLDHHPSFRAVIAAAPPLAMLASRLPAPELVGTLAAACGDLAHGFAAPPDSRRRIESHHRAWIAVREIDRAITEVRQRKLAPADLVQRAQRAIDRADILIGALLPA
jgi:hypothetical protein